MTLDDFRNAVIQRIQRSQSGGSAEVTINAVIETAYIEIQHQEAILQDTKDTFAAKISKYEDDKLAAAEATANAVAEEKARAYAELAENLAELLLVVKESAIERDQVSGIERVIKVLQK